MRWAIRTLMSICAFTSLTPVAMASSPYLDSAVSAIDSASAQSYLYLKKGSYKSSTASADFIFTVPADMRSKLRFDYRNRNISSALWQFDKPIQITIRSGGKCVTISVSKLEYGEGGVLTGNTDSTIVPTGPCRENEPLARIDDFLRLSPDSGDFFKGRVFAALSNMRKCVDATCATLSNGIPIRRAQFFGTTNPSGGILPAFRVLFKEGARIILPKNGMLALTGQSGATFDSLDYDIENDSGSGVLSKFQIVVSDGIISGGQTIFHLRPQSSLSADDVRFDKNGSSVSISRGSISGELGEGTSVLLTNDQAKTSTLNIRYAKASFAGLNYQSSGSGTTLSFLRGIMSTQLENGEIWFSDRNSIRVGYSNINVVLGCPEGSAIDTCKPVNWDSNGLSVYGTINAFSTTLEGGRFNIFDVGDVQIKSGKIAADTLTIDSANKLGPISGKLNKFELSVEGQNLQIDPSTRTKIARADVVANDLIFKPGQSLPIGQVEFSGVVDGVEGGKIGSARFDGGATLSLTVTRDDGDAPKIVNGRIEGDAKVQMDGGGFVQTRILVDRIRYYRGFGDASLKLTASDASYSFNTPSGHDSKGELGFEADVNVRSIRVVGRLAQPLVVGPTPLKVSNAQWTIDPVVGLPYKINVDLAEQELVYAPIKTPVGGTLCAPKVVVLDQHPFIAGKIDVFSSSSGGRINIYDNSLSAGVEVKVDDRGCDKVGALVCFAVGSALGGPIGGAALACICEDNLDKAKRQLTDAVRDESVKAVANSRFRFDY